MLDNIRDAVGSLCLYLTLCIFSTRGKLLLGPKVLLFFDEMSEEA